jgi:hypothetical protein
MNDIDPSVVSLPGLGVSDLYVERAVADARDIRAVLRACPSSRLLAQGADCLTEGVAHLREVAERLLGDGDPRRKRLEALAEGLLAEAAAFGESSDLLGAGESAE